MHEPIPQHDWPESWKLSYQYDLNEVFGRGADSDPRYAYAYRLRRRKALGLLTAVLQPPASILDVAAAQGNFTLALAELGYRVTWNDLRSELVNYVRLKHEFGSVLYAPGNVLDLNPSSLYDGILMTEVIEHVAHPDRFLSAVSSLVRPGGFIVMTTPNGANVRNKLPRFSDCADPSIFRSVQFAPDADGHIFLLYPDEIRRFSSAAGLVIDELVYFTNYLTTGHLKTAALLRILPSPLVHWVEALSQQVPSPLAERFLVQVGVRFRKPSNPEEISCA